MKNIHNVLSDIQDEIGHHQNLRFTLEFLRCITWIIRVRSPDGFRSAKIELDINEQDENVVAYLERYRGFAYQDIINIVNGIIERF
jgi:hypothetical protein